LRGRGLGLRFVRVNVFKFHYRVWECLSLLKHWVVDFVLDDGRKGLGSGVGVGTLLGSGSLGLSC
jgi:hypothetical protein